MKMPGRDVLEPGTLLQIPDREFDHGVLTMEPVGFNHGDVMIRCDERVVPPIGPQLCLGFLGETGPAHDQPDRALLAAFAAGVDRLSDLGPAAERVIDIDPPRVVDARDRLAHRL